MSYVYLWETAPFSDHGGVGGIGGVGGVVEHSRTLEFPNLKFLSKFMNQSIFNFYDLKYINKVIVKIKYLIFIWNLVCFECTRSIEL